MFNTYYKQRTQGISDADRGNYDQICDAIRYFFDQVKRDNKCTISVPKIKNWKEETQNEVRVWLEKAVRLSIEDIEEYMDVADELFEYNFSFVSNLEGEDKTNDVWDMKQAELQEEKERASAVILQALYNAVEDEDIRERQRPLLKLYVGLRIKSSGEVSREDIQDFLNDREIAMYEQYEQNNYEQNNGDIKKIIAGFLVEYTGRKPDTIRKDIKKFDKVMWKRVKNNFISKG